MFESLTSSLSNIFKKLARTGILNAEQVDSSVREIRMALIEADVSLPVIKELIEQIKRKAVGQEIIRSVSPEQMMIKIINDELINILSDPAEKQKAGNLFGLAPHLKIMMMVGLQGSGKTTSSAKLALLLKQHKKKVLLASTDIYRPAAQQQLQKLAETIGVDCLPIIAEQKPLEIIARALQVIQQENYDLLLIDTAGRMHIDDQMIEELKQLKQLANPQEILLVADALTGQDAINIAKGFNEALELSGIILTRIDGDARGGAALSIKHVTGKPIKFLGTGEKIDALERFHPERIVSRILGMGDIVSLVEKAATLIDEEEAKKAALQLQKGQFTLNDYLKQLGQLKKLGGIKSILNMLPGALGAKATGGNIDDKMFTKQQAIICSMTPEERNNPGILRYSRKMRIAAGSGTSIQAVNVLLKQYQQLSAMTKKFSKIDPKDFTRKDIFKSLFRR